MTTPAKYQRQPVEVDAMQFTEKSRVAVRDWVAAKGVGAELWNDAVYGDCLMIENADGIQQRVRRDQWVVQDQDGAFYPVSKKLFAKAYKRVK